MAIEILETTAIHEVIVILRRRIDHAAGALGLADEIVDLSAAIGRYANQNLAGRFGVSNLLGGELPILFVCHHIAWMVSENTMHDAVSSENCAFLTAPIA